VGVGWGLKEGAVTVFRLVTLNCNGIRSAANKGLLPWAASAGADCMGVQELKAHREDLEGSLDKVAGQRGHFHFAQKKGYSGVGLFVSPKLQPSDVITGFGSKEFDAEGRWVELRFDRAGQRLSIISCYFPSGSSGPDRQEAKFRFLKRMAPHLKKLQAEREFILVGDVNIAHRQADLKNWRSNQKNSGFLPEERAWLDKLLGAKSGLVDVYRQLEPHTTDECYTWWSQRGAARAKNVGWRLDYHIATPALAATAKKVQIVREPRLSDHAPVVVDYDFRP
jgi:exodeoxyribonuclease III